MKMSSQIINSNKNIIIDGGINTGKTTNILFPIIENIISNKESLFILDSKEEYINAFYNKFKENNYNIVIINFREFNKSEGWNPLIYPYHLFKNGKKDEALEYLNRIGNIIFQENNTSDLFWQQASSDLFTGMALGLFEDGKEEKINFSSIDNMLVSMSKRYGINDYLTEYFNYKGKDSKSYAFASTTILSSRDTKDSILSITKQKLNLYISREKLSQLLNKTTFNIEDISNKTTVVILIGKDENKTLSSIETMFIEQLYSILLDTKINKFNMILDNFDTISKSNELISMLESSVSRNIRLFISTHSVQEIIRNYGEYMLRLVDMVTILNKKVRLLINGEEHIFRNKFKNIQIFNSNIDYPILNNDKIQIFDIKGFVRNIKNYKNSIDIDELIKKIDNKIIEIDNKINDKKYINNVFDAYHGGYFGPSTYYYINKLENNKYEFRYGYSQTGIKILNEKDNPYLKTLEQTEDYYNDFISELLNETNNWKKEYVDNNIVDGTEWHIEISELGKKYVGLNSFPNNYDKVQLLFKKYFRSHESNENVANTTINYVADEKEQELLDSIKDEVDKELIELGLLHIVGNEEIYSANYKETMFDIQKRILKEKYNYDYLLPTEENTNSN